MLRSHRSHFSRKRSRKAWFLRAIHCGAGRSARPVACAKIFNQYLLKAALRTPSLPIYDQSRYKSDDKRIVLLSYRSYSHRWKY